MNYEYIEKLEYNTLDKLYDLTITTFNGDIVTARLGYFVVSRRYNMRMDLISLDLYKSTKWVGSLCTLNNIYNEFSIKEGDVLVYLPLEDISNLSKVPDNIKYGKGAVAKTKDDFINALKNKKIDKTRANFLDKRDKVNEYPIQLASNDSPAIRVMGGKILISSPTKNNTLSSSDNSNLSDNLSDNLSENTEDTIERVLVNQYIKFINK